MPRSRAVRAVADSSRDLPDTRLAAKHERLTARRYLVQEGRQQVQFLGSTHQGRSFVASRAGHHTLILPLKRTVAVTSVNSQARSGSRRLASLGHGPASRQ